MEEKAASPMKTALNFGLMTAGAMIVYSLILYVLDLDQNPWLPYFSYVLLIGGIYLGSKSYRDNYRGGYITYGNAVLAGFLISLAASVIVAIYTYFFFAFINPDAMAEMLAVAEEGMLEKGMSEEEIDQALAISRKMMSPGIMTIWAIFGNAIAGLILSLITSIFVKKEEPLDGFPTQEETE